MESILVQSHKINLNFETQISKNGRPFRLSGIRLLLDKPNVYIKELKIYRHSTQYTFRYLDKDEFFAFEFDPFGKFVQKITV